MGCATAQCTWFLTQTSQEGNKCTLVYHYIEKLRVHCPYLYAVLGDCIGNPFPRQVAAASDQATMSWMNDAVSGNFPSRLLAHENGGFSTDQYIEYWFLLQQPWERTLTCTYIYVCLFAGLDMASGLTSKCMFVCMFGLGFRPYKTLQDTEWLQTCYQ